MITVSNYNQQKNTIDWSTLPKQIVDNRNDVEAIMEFYDDDIDIKEAVDLFLKGINDNIKPKAKDDKKQSKSKPSATKYVIYWDGNFLTRKTLTSDYSKTDNVNFAYVWNENELEIAENIAKKFDALVLPIDEAIKMHELKEKSQKNRAKKETIEDVFLNSKYIRTVMPKLQMMTVMDYGKGEEKEFFIDKVKELDKILDDARKRQELPLMDSIVKLHFFYGQTDWYILDYDPNENDFFGYVILNGDTEMAEAGYISIDELKSLKNIEMDFHFDQEPLGKVLHSRYPKEYPVYKPENKKEVPAPAAVKKTKPKAVIHKTFVDNFSTEFQLIRRFYNIIKNPDVEIPFRKTQLLFVAFNKATVERKVRKTSDVADIFNQCNEKMRVLFEEYAQPTQAAIKVQFSDKKLLKEIEDYVKDVAINPAVTVLKKFISIQNTFPDVEKTRKLKNAIEKVIENDKNNRLTYQLKDAVKWIDDYLKNQKHPVETEVYGLSVPRSVCTNRIKCTGIDKDGKLRKGYKFEEHTGNVIKVRHNPNVKKSVLKKSRKAVETIKKKKTAGSLNYSIDENVVEKIVIQTDPVQPAASIQNMSVPQTAIEQVIEKPIENTPLPTPAIPAPVQQVKNKLMEMEFESLEMDNGWEEFMQNPAKNLKIGISGKPKNGKTAGSLQLANYLTKFGNVLYNFVDQGFNKSTKDLWIMNGLSTNPKATPTDVRTLDDLEKEIRTGNYSFVFIDMINDYIDMEKITPQEFKDRFIIKYPNVGFVLIFEVTKAGDFKGDQKWMHVVDAIAEVKDFLMEIRGRYGNGHHVIWEEGLRDYNPKKYNEIYGEVAAPINSDEIEII